MLYGPNRFCPFKQLKEKEMRKDEQFKNIQNLQRKEGILKRNIYKKMRGSSTTFLGGNLPHPVSPYFLDKNFICFKSYSPLRVIHEHDFLPLGTDIHFVQCRTCDVVYCILCGKRIGTIVTTGDHGLGKCIRSDMHRPKVPFQ